jgi:hypothetical protein
MFSSLWNMPRRMLKVFQRFGEYYSYHSQGECVRGRFGRSLMHFAVGGLMKICVISRILESRNQILSYNHENQRI